MRHNKAVEIVVDRGMAHGAYEYRRHLLLIAIAELDDFFLENYEVISKLPPADQPAAWRDLRDAFLPAPETEQEPALAGASCAGSA